MYPPPGYERVFLFGSTNNLPVLPNEMFTVLIEDGYVRKCA